jgi:hypothetical protein
MHTLNCDTFSECSNAVNGVTFKEWFSNKASDFRCYREVSDRDGSKLR